MNLNELFIINIYELSPLSGKLVNWHIYSQFCRHIYKYSLNHLSKMTRPVNKLQICFLNVLLFTLVSGHLSCSLFSSS